MTDLSVTISHLENYPLITQKRADYLIFKQIFGLIKSKEHLTTEGLYKIIALKAGLNLGFPEQLKTHFPTVISVDRPRVANQNIKDPNWLAGFIDGDGSFRIKINKSSSTKSGYSVFLVLSIVQHGRDEDLLKSFNKYLNCGVTYRRSGNAITFSVVKFSDIKDIIIPFLNKYPLLGVKSKDFEYFCKGAELIKSKKHLTEEGLDQLHKIKNGMNTGRKFF